MSKLTDDDIRHLAMLSKISVTDDEVELFRVQLEEILDYVEQLNQVDTTNVQPTSQVTGLINVNRKDEDRSDEMDRDKLLDQTPAKQDGQIKVRRVI